MASSGSGYMKISATIGAHAQRKVFQPPTRRNTPARAGTNEYMSNVMIRYRAQRSRKANVPAISPRPASRADSLTGPIGRRHQKSSASEHNGTSQPWEYCGLSQLDRAFMRPGQ